MADFIFLAVKDFVTDSMKGSQMSLLIHQPTKHIRMTTTDIIIGYTRGNIKFSLYNTMANNRYIFYIITSIIILAT